MKIKDVINEARKPNSTVDRLILVAKDPNVDVNLRNDVINILSQLQRKGEQPMNEQSVQPSQIISQIESDEDYYQKILDSDPRLKAIAEKKIKEAEATGFTVGAALGQEKPFAGLQKTITDAVMQLRQLPEMYKKVVAKECIHMVVEGVPHAHVVKFLQQCATPNRLIDLPTIVSRSGSGTLPIPEQYVEICRRIARLTPGSSNAATGKGELMLILIGNDTEKATPGDILVDKTPIEVKASDSTGSALSDFVLGKMDTKSARTILVNAVNKTAGTTVLLDKEAKFKSADGSAVGISGIGRDTLPVLNQYFSQMGRPAVQQMFSQMLSAAVGSGLDQQISEVVGSISEDGTLDPAKIIPPMKKLVFDFYQLKNKHAGLLALNIESLNYTMSLTGDEFAGAPEILVTKIFDFRPVASSILSIKRK